MWWKGMLDSISIDFPSVNILLFCSTAYDSVQIFESWKADEWTNSTNLETRIPAPVQAGKLPIANNEISVTKEQLFELINNWLDKQQQKFVH